MRGKVVVTMAFALLSSFFVCIASGFAAQQCDIGYICGDANEGEREFALGAAVAVSTSPYKSYDVEVLPLPFINVRYDRFYFSGLGAGFNILRNETHEVSIGASYFGLQFRPRKTDAPELKPLNKRRSTVMAEASYSLTTNFGQFRARAAQDILGNSDGFIGDLSFRIPLVRNSTMTLAPGVGVQWANERQNDYYFGVSRSEAARGGASYYKAKDNFTPYFVFEGMYNINECWSVFAGARLDILTSEVRNSPMVGRSCTVSVAAGMQFRF